MEAMMIFIEKKKIFEKPNNQKQNKTKMSFSSSTNSQYLFSKISDTGHWVSRIN
jgi:hypothetical protein